MAPPTNPTLQSKDTSLYRGSGELDFREMLGMKTGQDYADAEMHRFKKARLAAQVQALKKR
ncbi:hypothetical protein [Methylorubrum extorquens]